MSDHLQGQEPGGLCFESCPGRKSHCSRDRMSKQVVVIKASHDHGGVMMSLQIWAMERGKALCTVHQEPRTHTLEVQ